MGKREGWRMREREREREGISFYRYSPIYQFLHYTTGYNTKDIHGRERDSVWVEGGEKREEERARISF